MFTQTKKIEVDLNDFPSEIEIQHRLFIAKLSPFQISLLQEIIHHSLIISLDDLADEFEMTAIELKSSLTPLLQIGLFTIRDEELVINKETRKIFECHLSKFEKKFRPDLNHMQQILNLLPIHLLPEWYAISKTSNHIFSSLIEEYFQSAKRYFAHLADLNLQNPKARAIMQKVYSAKGYTVLSEDLKKELKISDLEFHRIILELELNFACFLSYQETENGWEEIVTPLYEWKEFLLAAEQIILPDKFQPIPLKKKVSVAPSAKHHIPKNLSAVQRSLKKFSPNVWIKLDRFIETFCEPLNKHAPVHLAQTKLKWKYCLPVLSEEEKTYVSDVMTYILFNEDVIQMGLYNQETYFCVTSNGYHTLH